MAAFVRVDIRATLDQWIAALDQYSLQQLQAQPPDGGWSLGQVYMHLLNEAEYHLEQFTAALSSNEHSHEDATPEGRTMLNNNSFPDIRLQGPPENAAVPQPESENELKAALLLLREQFEKSLLMLSNDHHGKSKHPGLGYFTAEEWLQFADMHMRHHLRQKKRIDKAIGPTS